MPALRPHPACNPMALSVPVWMTKFPCSPTWRDQSKFKSTDMHGCCPPRSMQTPAPELSLDFITEAIRDSLSFGDLVVRHQQVDSSVPLSQHTPPTVPTEPPHS